MATQALRTLSTGVLAALLFGGISEIATAADGPDFADSVMNMSLEELMEVQVEIVSKKPTLISTTPAAVTVINAEDIRRSGARTLPEILRQAPGVQAAQQNANYWRVVSVNSLDDAARYQFVFFGKDVNKPGSDWYEERHSQGVLTFGQNGKAGCIFNFLLVDGRLRFDLDMTLAKRAGMRVDSRLLKLARRVHHKP